MSKSSDYWEKRQRERESKVFKTAKEAEKALEIELLQAKEEILSKTNNLINTYMSETEMSYAKAVRTLKGKEYRVWQKDIEGYLKDLKKYKKVNPEKYKEIKLELETLATRSRITRLEALKTQIDNTLNKKSFEDEKEIKKYVSSVYQSSFESIQTDMGITGVNTILPIEEIEKLIQYPWSGENFSERIWNNRDDLSKTLKSEITQAFIQGINPKEIIKRVESRMGSSHKNTVRLVRTELNYAMNQATKRTYEDDEIEEYEFLAEIDDMTSAVCRGLHRQRFKTKDAKVGVNYPPMHPHCRSTTTPVIDYESIGKNNTVKDSENNDIIKENTTKFVEAKTIIEANKFAKNEIGIQADYKGIDIKCANEWNKGLYDMKNKFPEIIDNIKFVGSAQSRNALIKKELLEYFKNDFLNKGYSLEYSEQFAKRNTKFLMAGLKATKREMASSLSIKPEDIHKKPYLAILKKYEGICMNNKVFNNYDEITSDKIEQVKLKWKPVGCGTVKATFDHEFGHQIDSFLKVENEKSIIKLAMSKSNTDMRESLSGYANTDINEFIAEGWSEYCNNPNPREIANEIGKTIERLWEKWKS